MTWNIQKAVIAPSILSADPMKFADELAQVDGSLAGWHHIDVMDGHFVPNLTFGLGLIERLKQTMKLPLDVHIMVSNPDQVAMQYVEAGADMLTFHVEAAIHAHRIVQNIKGAGRKAGLVVNPATPVESTFALLDDIDCVMLMSVNPGFGGQSFIPYTLEKCRRLSSELSARGLSDRVIIEVDGGVNASTIADLYLAGARLFVAGSAVYGKENRSAAVEELLFQIEN